MTDLRGYKPEKDVETSSNRSKMMGAAVVVLGLGALGAYAFASQNSPTPANDMQMASNPVPTTPRGAQQQMPPPVTDPQPTPTTVPPKAESTPLDNTPLMPSSAGKVTKSAGDRSQHAAVKAPSATPDMTPPENAAPQPPTEPAATPEQPQPQETPAPTENIAPPQGQ